MNKKCFNDQIRIKTQPTSINPFFISLLFHPSAYPPVNASFIPLSINPLQLPFYQSIHTVFPSQLWCSQWKLPLNMQKLPFKIYKISIPVLKVSSKRQVFAEHLTTDFYTSIHSSIQSSMRHLLSLISYTLISHHNHMIWSIYSSLGLQTAFHQNHLRFHTVICISFHSLLLFHQNTPSILATLNNKDRNI